MNIENIKNTRKAFEDGYIYSKNGIRLFKPYYTNGGIRYVVYGYKGKREVVKASTIEEKITDKMMRVALDTLGTDRKVYTPHGICIGEIIQDKDGNFFLEVKHRKLFDKIMISTYKTYLFDTVASKYAKNLKYSVESSDFDFAQKRVL